MTKKKNSNCLDGMRCPNRKCRSLGPFKIRTTCIMEWCDDGTDHSEDAEMADGGLCICCKCKREGTVEDFQSKKQASVKLTVPALLQEAARLYRRSRHYKCTFSEYAVRCASPFDQNHIHRIWVKLLLAFVPKTQQPYVKDYLNRLVNQLREFNKFYSSALEAKIIGQACSVANNRVTKSYILHYPIPGELFMKLNWFQGAQVLVDIVREQWSKKQKDTQHAV